VGPDAVVFVEVWLIPLLEEEAPESLESSDPFDFDESSESSDLLALLDEDSSLAESAMADERGILPQATRMSADRIRYRDIDPPAVLAKVFRRKRTGSVYHGRKSPEAYILPKNFILLVDQWDGNGIRTMKSDSCDTDIRQGSGLLPGKYLENQRVTDTGVMGYTRPYGC
jgi:hypothetical protein